MKLKKTEAIQAWHLCGGMKLRDGTPLEQGKIYHVPNIMMCKRGLHASVKPLDALQYAPGVTVCRVRCWGEIIEGTNKIVSEYRVADKIIDGDFWLAWWACDIAESVLGACGVSDQRGWNAIEAKRSWLCCNTSDGDLGCLSDAAHEVAREAAWHAAWNVACAAARNVAWGAARDVAWDEINASLESYLLDLC